MELQLLLRPLAVPLLVGAGSRVRVRAGVGVGVGVGVRVRVSFAAALLSDRAEVEGSEVLERRRALRRDMGRYREMQ